MQHNYELPGWYHDIFGKDSRHNVYGAMPAAASPTTFVPAPGPARLPANASAPAASDQCLRLSMQGSTQMCADASGGGGQKVCVAYDPTDPSTKARAAVSAAASALSSTTCKDYLSCAATAASQLTEYGACSKEALRAVVEQDPILDTQVRAIRHACGLPAESVNDLASGCRAVLAMYDRQAAVDICDPNKKSWAELWRSLSPAISRTTCTIDPLLLQPKSARLFACSISGPLTSEAASIASAACAGGASGPSVSPGGNKDRASEGESTNDSAECIRNAQDAAKILGASAASTCAPPAPGPSPPPARRKSAATYWTWKNIGIAIACVIGVSIIVASIAALSSALSAAGSNSTSGRKRKAQHSMAVQPSDGVEGGENSSATAPALSAPGGSGAGVLDLTGDANGSAASILA